MSAGAPPQTTLGELTALPRPPIAGFGEGKGKGGRRAGKDGGKEGKWEGEEGEREGSMEEGRMMIHTPCQNPRSATD